MDPYTSALHVLPIVYDKIEKNFRPSIVLDVGCNKGEWLLAARVLDRGVLIRGLDILPYEAVSHNLQSHEYVQADLRDPTHIPTDYLDGHYDLCICVEVAEHLYPRDAPVVVFRLCQTSPRILFSAAQPGQGPTHEQWPDEPDDERFHHNEQPREYWHKLFAMHGYTPVSLQKELNHPDILPHIDPWYRNNCTLYVRKP